MNALTVEKLCQRILECRLVDAHKLERAVADAGGPSASVEVFATFLQRNEICTNWQIQQLMEDKKHGYFYGDWKVLFLVGAGTHARVYRVCHSKTNAFRAIKVLRKRYSADVEAKKNFLRQGNTGNNGKNKEQDNSGTIYEIGEANGQAYLVVDFIEAV